MKKPANTSYPWKFASVGGTVRVNIQSGEDIRHLGELDRKLWTVLSCPTSGLEFDETTLKLIDVDKDGKIRVDEVIKTAQWLTRILKNADDLLKENDSLPLDGFNTEDPDGARLQASARQILKNLQLEKDSISLEDTADNVKIFAQTQFNGDGIITPASAPDEATAKLIETIAGIASVVDRSGVPGITAEHVEAFYAACADFQAWMAAGTKDVFPYGDKTADALAAVNAIKDKVADYFMRCKLIGFDAASAEAVDVSVAKIAAIEGNLAAASEEIGLQPLAKPSADGKLNLKAVNPAWKAAIDAVVTLVDIKKDAIDEAEWTAILGTFAPYVAWMDAKKGAEVEALGLDCVKAILKEDKKAVLLELIEKDKAEEANALSIEEVDKVLRLNKHFYRFLNNYVVLADFYDPARKAMFQAGRLYIDQRSTDLCVKVAGPAPEISSLSGMYILYCSCVSEKLGKSFNIAAVLTDGDVDGLREGKNAVFYDRDGNDYTAKVVAIVDNPISIRQAFWAPYRKLARMINDRIDKKAAEKNEKSMSGLTSAADTATEGKAPAVPFDIGKFAGIFAAIGMAVGLVGAALAGVVSALKGITFWQILLILGVLMLLISGPSMFIAWRKIRRRDLGPVLNANGWAINAAALVRAKFGKTLTSLAQFPKLTAVDAEARKKANARKFWSWFCGLLVVACVALWLCNVLAPIGIKSPLSCYKETVEAVEEAPVAEEAPAEAELPAAEEVPAAE
ncbi:MAG: hypothetical protein VZR22_08765 [Candidatus Cryptobacteroides sp.]|nr:hypothetical protein [Candidatus Cryptobacteroides sp.]